MSSVFTWYEVLEIAALDVANGNKERLADVVSLTPQVTGGWVRLGLVRSVFVRKCGALVVLLVGLVFMYVFEGIFR